MNRKFIVMIFFFLFSCSTSRIKKDEKNAADFQRTVRAPSGYYNVHYDSFEEAVSGSPKNLPPDVSTSIREVERAERQVKGIPKNSE